MIETLNNLDIAIFSFLNGMNNTYLDYLMWIFSGKFTWVPMCCVLIIFMFIKSWKQAILILVMIALVITFADQISSTFIKPFVERLRPSHNDALNATIHTVNGYRGGLYGFVSSHAANSFGVAFLLILIFKRWYFTVTLLGWAIIVSYSRIYLGVHYPGDILGGTALGLFCGWIVYLIYQYIGKYKYFKMYTSEPYTREQSLSVTAAILLNMVVMTIGSYFML
ncbi:MAG: phosphatase PAP2 family protein [Muribaculaceae bacterium]